MENSILISQRRSIEYELDSPRTDMHETQISMEQKRSICKCNAMGRNLVVCIDGTSNQFGQKNTNVIELYRNLVKDNMQATFYNSGIGTYAKPSWKSWSYWKQVIDHKVDLAIAWNFENIVIDAYRWLSNKYVDGDRIFLFGFSRGAYQVRALSAMIDKVGLIHEGNEGQIRFAYELYADLGSKKEQQASSDIIDAISIQTTIDQNARPPDMAEMFKKTFSRDVWVHFVGAWDTVSSVGVVRERNLPGTTDGMQHVCFFRHALALDERRVKFLPEYAWGGVARNSTRRVEGKHTEQRSDLLAHTKEVWFAGTHSDIGGGNVSNPNMDRGKPPLRWMYREAQSAGLRLKDTDLKLEWATLGVINESLTWVWQLFECFPIKQLSYKDAESTMTSFHLGKGRQIQPGQKIHPSVIFSDGYSPKAILQTTNGPLHNWLRLFQSDRTASSDFDSLWSWVESDLSDIAQSIIRDIDGLTTDPLPVKRLKQIISTDEGVAAIRQCPNAVESLSLAWRNLEYEQSIELVQPFQSVILAALRKMDPTTDFSKSLHLQTALGITTLVISSNGILASGFLDGTIRIWDAITGHMKQEIKPGHAASVTSIDFSPDGKKIVSGSGDRMVKVWDITTGETSENSVIKHKTRVTCVAFTRNNPASVVSASLDQTVRSRNIASGGTREVPLEEFTAIDSFAFSHDGILAASGSSGRTIRVWNVQTGKAMSQPFEGHTGSVNCIAFSPDGKRLGSGAGDGTVRVWDIATGYSSRPFEGHSNSVTSISFSADGKHVVSGSMDRTIRVWEINIRSSEAIGTPFAGHNSSVTSVAFSPDGNHFISGSLDGSIRIWYAHPFRGHEGPILCVVYSSDGTRVASGSYDRTIRVWNSVTGEAIGEPFVGHEGIVGTIAFSPDKRHIVSGGQDRTVLIWDVETGKLVRELFRGQEYPIRSVAFSPDGKHVVAGSYDRTIRVWDASTGDSIGNPFQGHELPVYAVAYFPDGKRIVSSSGDGTIRVWDARTGKARGNPFRGHKQIVTSVAVSPDGKHVISGSVDNTIRVWDAMTGEAKKVLEGHKGPVVSVAHSPDGKFMVSGSWDLTIRIWDMKTGEVIGKPLKGHGGRIASVAVSPDGLHVVAGSENGVLSTWDLAGLTDSSSSGWQPHSFPSLRPITTGLTNNNSPRHISENVEV